MEIQHDATAVWLESSNSHRSLALEAFLGVFAILDTDRVRTRKSFFAVTLDWQQVRG
jgi:hypothetical protein